MAADEDLEKLVTRHADLIGAAIRRVCARRFDHLAADARQEVHIALWKQLQRGKKIERPASYIYKVALTTALAIVKRVEREASMVAEAEQLRKQTDAPSLGIDDTLERSQRLDQALDRLDDHNRRALRCYLAGFNHRETAELLGISESAARHAIYRGIDRLRATLRQAEDTQDDQ